MKLRDSETDPLRVDFLRAGLPGRIGIAMAPGQKDGRIWDRDLRRDLQRLRDHYETALLVSLIDSAEAESLQLGHLEAMAAGAGITVAKLAIPDGSVPPSQEACVKLVDQILGVAFTGATVVIHCREGRGRSGLVAAACLTALGRDPAEALSATRAARPGAVETADQAEFVCRFAELWRRVRGP